MTRTLDIPEKLCRRVERRIGSIGYTLPKLTVKLYTIWLDGGIKLDDEPARATLSSDYTSIFGIVKDEIDPDAPHDMDSIRANIASHRTFDMLTCEKGSRRLANVEVIKDKPKGGL